MTRTLRNILFFFILLVVLTRCKEKYVSPYKSADTSYLVVEGYISGNGPTQFMLSRTVPLTGNTSVPPERGAQVQVEGDDNNVYSLTESSDGHYTIDTMPLDPAANYRLRIKTFDGKEYLSDYVPYKKTPAIDSLNWSFTPAEGIRLYVNTHDAANATHYYQWAYNETWEYRAAELSYYKYDPGANQVIDRQPSEQIYTCWKSLASTRLILGNSTKLTSDVIYLQQLDQIPANTQPLGVTFSMIVSQYALTEDGYNFLSLMQKNTESLGSIFDAQPSALKGNIHCLTNPNEQVVGFISAGTLEQKRMFVYNYELPEWRYAPVCSLPDTVVGLGGDALKHFFADLSYIPITPHYPMGGPPDGWIANMPSCVDCREQGGTTTRPSFWPY